MSATHRAKQPGVPGWERLRHGGLLLDATRLAALSRHVPGPLDNRVGRQWRLRFAGLDYDTWCEWDLDLWFEEGELSPQVTAVRTPLGPGLWTPETEDAAAALLQAIRDTRKGQAELSEVLGERVREAVEILIRGHGEALSALAQVSVAHAGDRHGSAPPPLGTGASPWYGLPRLPSFRHRCHHRRAGARAPPMHRPIAPSADSPVVPAAASLEARVAELEARLSERP